MTKKAAMTIAAGLVTALVAGAAAFSLGLNAPEASSASPRKHQKPIVRTVERTITVHRKDGGKQQGGEVRVVAAPSTRSSQPGISGDDDAHELEHDEDEGEEHEDGGHEDD